MDKTFELAKAVAALRDIVFHVSRGIDSDWSIDMKERFDFVREQLLKVAAPTATPEGNRVVKTRDAVADVLSEVVYCCTRDWSAWQVNTMTESDFHPAAEDEELLDSIVEAVLNL